MAKILRLDMHIRYAAEHGELDEVNSYLRGLSPKEWFMESKLLSACAGVVAWVEAHTLLNIV